MSDLAGSRTGAPPVYVSDVSFTGGLRITFSGSVDRDVLRKLGGRKDWFVQTWRFDSPDDAKAARILSELRDHGVPLLGAGPGWHPGGIFELFRERGLISGSYQRLSFTGRGWIVETA